MLHEPVRHYVEEMSAPVSNLRSQRRCANLLPAPLKYAELLLFLAVKPRRRDLETIGQGNNALQAEIDTEGRRIALLRLR